MIAVLYGSGVVLAIAAVAATIIYTRAVAHSSRAYVHVVLASLFLLAIEAVAISSVGDEPTLAQLVLLIANLTGIGAMAALSARFRPPPERRASPEGRSAFAWYRENRGYVGYVAMLLVVVVALWEVDRSAEDAGEAADKAEQLALTADQTALTAEETAKAVERFARRLQRTIRDNSELICTLSRAVSSVPIKQRGGESARDFALRVAGLRAFVKGLRDLADCTPPPVVVIPRSEREALERGQSALPRGDGGGDVDQSGSAPGQQPGPPQGGPPSNPPGPGNPPTNPPPNNPPRGPDGGILDPLLDDVCDTVNGLGVPLC